VDDEPLVIADTEALVIAVVEDSGRTDRDREFDETYRRIHVQLAGIARRHTHDEDGAQDVLQSAVYKAFVRWRSGKPIENLEAYLTSCLVSACMDLHRWSRRQRRALERLGASQQWFVEGAHDAVVRRVERDAVSVAFTKLTSECQELLRLRIVDGVPVKEVADRLLMAQGTVKSKCSRCLDQLDRLMDD
jgi:RNA polymerase sigma-70 factor, ECF subfamily